MKIAVASDLHLEFGSLELKNSENADVLILSGDILLAEDVKRHPRGSGGEVTKKSTRLAAALSYYDFFDQISVEFPNVVYVAGNHEFYDGKWNKTISVLKQLSDAYVNVHFLERETIKIDDVTFIGSTLWTDLNRGDALTCHAVKDMMNDYKKIINDANDYSHLRPSDTSHRHFKSVQYIEHVVAERSDEKFVVVGHHAPCFNSVPYWFSHEHLMNGAYASDLSEFILDRPQIKLWTHGHIHSDSDYMIGDTRVVCNPRGYIGYESRAKDFELKYVEI